ncbi:MAG: YceI family protein [Flavipsychrobacter sp.]|nr:YceI family protein [Flavipsychrobacter sp.]
MKTLLASLLLLQATVANAQHYVPESQNSKVSFKVMNHMLVKSTVQGTLSNLSGSIIFNPADLPGASFDVSVNPESIKTGIGMRDEHLKKEEFLSVSKFPRIRIISNRVEKSSAPGTYILYGKLTIKGISKAITIPFTATPTNGGLLFKGTFTLNRLDYTVGEKGKIEDQVNVNLSVSAKKA